MSRKFIPYGRHSIDEDDRRAVIEALSSAALTRGPAVERFEAALAERVGRRFAVAVSSGTAGLHVAALAAGLGPGDVAMTSAITFVASANGARYCGASIAIADIQPNSLALAPPEVGPDVKAVVPVDFGGLVSGLAEIRDRFPRAVVIEDAAHSFGGHDEAGIPAGGSKFADMAVFSFHPVKTITAAEGGAVVTDDPDLARRLRLYRGHGIERAGHFLASADQAGEPGGRHPWYYEQQVLGFNYFLSDLHAALGLSQMTRAEKYVARRRAIATRYDALLHGLPGVARPQSDPAMRARSAHHLYVVEIDFPRFAVTRAELMTRLRTRDIGTQVHYIPLYRQPYYADPSVDPARAYPHAERYYARCLSLPVHPALTDEEVDYVVASLKHELGL